MKKHDTLEREHFFKKRRIKFMAGGLSAIVLASGVLLGVKGCKRSDNKTNDIEPTTVSTLEETISTGEYLSPIIVDREETDQVEDYSIIVNTEGTLPTYINNGYSYYSGSTSSTTGMNTVTEGTTIITELPNIPDVTNLEEVEIIYDEEGHIEEIVWPTVETTINATMPNVEPTGDDPSIDPPIIYEDSTPNSPTPTPTPAQPSPTPTPVPAPTGDIPDAEPTVHPTEPNPTIPTPRPTVIPTVVPPEPTTEPTLPPIPTGDLPGEAVTVYDTNDELLGETIISSDEDVIVRDEIGSMLVNVNTLKETKNYLLAMKEYMHYFDCIIPEDNNKTVIKKAR